MNKLQKLKNKKQKLEQKAAVYDAIQSSVKILLNTAAFGYIGSRWGQFNDYDEAERITRNGRKITKKMLECCKKHDSFPIKWDTDGAIVTVPEKYRGSFDSEMNFVNLIEDEINQWINEGGLEC